MSNPGLRMFEVSAMNHDFLKSMDGTFHGILQWVDLDKLWGRVREDGEGWYVSLVGTEPVQKTLTVAELETFIIEVDSLLRRDHQYHYCGIVYVDDPALPSLIKIYDPNNVGNSCGCSGVRTLPRWVLSKMPPVLIEDHAPLPGNRRHWWQKMFG